MAKKSKDNAKRLDLPKGAADDRDYLGYLSDKIIPLDAVNIPGEGPVVPRDDDWVEFAETHEAELEAQDEELRQGWHKLHKAVDSGVDEERGPYDVIPLSMVRGGHTTPTQVFKKPMKHLQLDQSIPPRGWYKSKHEPKNVRPRPCYTEAILTTPYGGFCPVGCSFCYINNGTRGYRATGLPTVDPTYPDKFRKQLDKMMISGAGYMTSFSEAFHVLEDTYHVTQRLTQVFLDAALPIFYCTRRLPADWAMEALQQNPYSYIQWSVNTSNPVDYKRLSPGAAKLDDIFSTVSYLSERGVYTSFQCNPIHPGITSLQELVDLVNIASEAGLDHIIFKFCEQVANSRNVIVDRLRARRFDPAKIAEFDKLFNQVIGGVYTIQESVRREWLDTLLEATRAADITMSLCYEYYADGGAGSNMAPWYTTSDQCHGRGVPIHYRTAPGELFQPFPCYRKGCLYCEETGTKACNNPELLDAKALQYSDLKRITIKEPKKGWNWGIDDACAHPDNAMYSLARNPGLLTDAELWGWEKPWDA